MIPTDVVFHPSWWHKNTGITFDKDFFFHPKKRVECEQQMERELYERFGQYGLGDDRHEVLPMLGAVHLASGYLLSEMLGCRVEYSADAPPQVIAAGQEELRANVMETFDSEPFHRLKKLVEQLRANHGYVCGDINWSGVLNLALDLRGEAIFMDMVDKPDEVKKYFWQLAEVAENFWRYIEDLTGTTSISVNRNVRHLSPPVLLHSECSHTMISEAMYEDFLMPIDKRWSDLRAGFGIHHCGKDPHRFASSYAKLPNLAFLDVGWGGDVKLLREHLPRTFLNLRLDPVSIGEMTVGEIDSTIRRLVDDSHDPWLTGVCCINMDDKVGDDKVRAIFETTASLCSPM
jgi:hypothetical protein